jgi:hypothetical protein
MPSGCVTQEELQRLLDRQLSKEESDALVARINSCVNCRRLWMRHAAKPSEEKKPPQGGDFIQRLESEIDHRVEKVAERLLEINMINGGTAQPIIDEIFGDCPRPENLGKRIFEKCKELRLKKKTAC